MWWLGDWEIWPGNRKLHCTGQNTRWTNKMQQTRWNIYLSHVACTKGQNDCLNCCIIAQSVSVQIVNLENEN